jgi:hypothetical protein
MYEFAGALIANCAPVVVAALENRIQNWNE